jgi:hypothetical protein
MINDLRKTLTDLFDRFESRCLWLSGGKDSRLLFEVMLAIGKPFDVVRFDEGWTLDQKRQVERLILEHKLQVFSYPPVQNLLVANPENPAAISYASQYPIDGEGRMFTLVRDFVDEPKRCVFDVQIEKAKVPWAPIEFELHIVGTKLADAHWLSGSIVTESEWTSGNKTFAAPLAGWSDKDVEAQLLYSFGIDLSGEKNTGDIEACTKCFSGPAMCPKAGVEIPAFEWNPQANLDALRAVLA